MVARFEWMGGIWLVVALYKSSLFMYFMNASLNWLRHGLNSLSLRKHRLIGLIRLRRPVKHKAGAKKG